MLTDKIEAIGSTKEQALETLGLSSGGDTKDIFLRQVVQQMSHIDHLLKKAGTFWTPDQNVRFTYQIILSCLRTVMTSVRTVILV